MTWSNWLRAELKHRGWTPDLLAAECKGAVTASAIRKQIAGDRTPQRASRYVIENALGKVWKEGGARVT